MSRQNLSAGEFLFRADTPSSCGYLIEQGTVELRIHHTSGDDLVPSDIVVARLGPGELVGDISASEGLPHSVDAVALTDCVVLEIDGGQIRDRLAASDPILRMVLDGRVKRWRRLLALVRGEVVGSSVAVGATNASAHGKFLLEEQLREALREHRLEVRYQPILEIASDTIVGYEALGRWMHPERGEVAPEEFIHLAEETSLIVPVGEYVFDAAFAALDRLRAEPMPFVAVNVSARQLASEGLIERVVERREALRLPPGCIKVEITESQALDADQVARVIAACHAQSIGVSLDDFGTRYSHLAHLHLLEVDTLKIDQSFVRAMFTSDKAMQIVRAIVAMARAIGADIVVEGVETREQLQFLGDLGCRYAQGFVIGRASPLDAVLAAR